jgi:photosystem II stability/assembly factor-like uncharacterized protein
LSDKKGKNWKKIKSPTKNWLKDIKVINDELIVIVGDNSTLLFSKDMGNTWDKLYNKIKLNFHAVEYLDNKILLGCDFNQILHFDLNTQTIKTLKSIP